MRFYTSYFGNVGNIGDDVVKISISLWSPRTWHGWKMRSLAPSEDILREYKQNGDVDRYIERYCEEILRNKDCAKMVEDLGNKFGGRDICFLCYESKGKFCQRNLVSTWLRDNGYPCREW